MQLAGPGTVPCRGDRLRAAVASRTGRIGLILFVNLGMIAFVVVRAAAVWGALIEYGVNPWIFLFLDVVSCPPYTWGLSRLALYLSGQGGWRRLLLGGTATLAGFLTPFAFAMAAGMEQMPADTRLLIVAVLAVMVVAGPVRHLLGLRRRPATVVSLRKEPVRASLAAAA